MAINTTAFAAALQTKMNATTDAKEMLLLGKAYESTEANIVLADINAAGVVATTKASEASSSATSATGSASTATTKAAAALASEGVATTKASEASASATAASGSASSASGSATTATTKASEASASATAAATSESNAASAAATAVNAVIDTAPANLNTLNELAAALGDDANYAATVTTALATKAPQTTTYTKTETDAKVVELSPPATKAHVDSLGINAATLTGALPAISGASLTGISGPMADQVYEGQWDFTLEGAGNSAGHDLGTYSASPGKYLVELVMRSTNKHSDPDGALFQLNVDGVSLGSRNYIQCQEITNDYSVSGQDSTAVGIIPVEITSTTIMRFHAWDSDNDSGGWIGRWQARVIRIG